ncbi:MAG: AEC family transporter [Phycisphaerae bacterium]|nr:AEC family transporter [Phycisphaerae bacterium]
MFQTAADIFVRVILPVLAIVLAGAAVQRIRAIDVRTLVSFNIYLFIPAFLYTRVAASDLSWLQIGGVGLVVLLPMAVLGLPVVLALRARGSRGNAIAAVAVGGLFFNAGNFGIPVAELAFGPAGGSVQALVVMFVNTTIFFFGYLIIALAQGKGARACLGYFRLPMIYAIVAALLVRDTKLSLPAWLDQAIATVAGGMVPVALATLGAQLASRARWPRWRLVVPVMSMKLLLLPAVTAALVWALDRTLWPGLWPWPGAQLVLAAAGPTAVNTLLLTVELEGDADTAADCVFWTTLACAVTVTVVLALILSLGGGPPAG